MVFKDSAFFIVDKGYLNANFSVPERKGSILFQKLFFVTDRIWIKNFEILISKF